MNANDRAGTVLPISLCRLAEFEGTQIANLSELISDPYSQELTTVKCNDGMHIRARCETLVECRRIVAPFVACDTCIARIAKEDLAKIHKASWERICPERFRKTDTTHADFPRAIYADLKAGDPKQSLFLFGPTGYSKTRVGMLMLKRALLRGLRVGVLWPEKLRMLTSGFDTVAFDRYAEYDALLMDDSLLTACRESKLLDTVKLLLDVRMRHERLTIFTSQIGSEDEIAQAKDFGEAKSADLERIKAIVRRLRESCRIVSFAKVEAGDNQGAF